MRRRALGQLQLGRRMIGVGEREGVVHRDLHGLDRSGLAQPADHAVRDSGDIGQLAHQPLALADPFQRLSPLGRQPLGHEAGGPIFRDGAPALQRTGRGERHAQHRGQRGEIIIGGPLDQPPKGFGQRRQVVGLEQGPKAVVADRFRLEPVLLPHHPRHLPRPERREHDRPGRHLHPVRNAVIERPESGVEKEDSAAVHAA
jgi:hypothetical protein